MFKVILSIENPPNLNPCITKIKNTPKAQHEGIVDLDTYQKVQERLAKKAKPRLRKDYSREYPIRGYALCHECLDTMTGSPHRGKSGKRYPHYWCKNKKCIRVNKTYPRDLVEADFKKLLVKIAPKPKVLVAIEMTVLDVWQTRQKLEHERRKATQGEVRRLDAEIEAMSNQLAKIQRESVLRRLEENLDELLNKKTPWRRI